MRAASKALIAAGVIAGLLLTSPFIMGILVKNEFYHLISDLNSPGQFEIQVLEYQQGWFTSAADVQYTIKTDTSPNFGINSSNTPTPPFQFVLREKIYHGPIIFLPHDKEKKIHFAQSIFESNIDDKQYPIIARTIIQIDGKMITTLQADKISNAVEQMEGVSFVFQKIDGKFGLNQKHKDAQGHLTLGTIDLLMNKGQFRIKNVDLGYKLKKSENEIWEGKRNITFANLLLDTPKNKQLILRGFTLDLFNSIMEEKMQTGANLKLNSVQVDGKNYGEQTIELAINNLDVKSLADIQKHAQAIGRQNIPVPILLTQFYQLTMNLLSNGLKIDLNKFDLNTSQGAVRAQINIELQPRKETIYSPLQLLEKLHAIAYLQLPTTMFEEFTEAYYLSRIKSDSNEPTKPAKERIKEWVKAGWLTTINDDIKIKLKFEKQQLFINDKLVPMEQAAFFSGKLIPISPLAQAIFFNKV